ncbi:hypothetical protein Pint_20389 [Pistacia integerrima]|uniref:Uncharacterized protein n=1 Tax=Pistacia integerrima TaxID=434235 RepID=A0ACC0X9V8_9ROSI|nr:hypothetical protein Pint_20389 [Pistacia integerrima]
MAITTIHDNHESTNGEQRCNAYSERRFSERRFSSSVLDYSTTTSPPPIQQRKKDPSVYFILSSKSVA